MPLTQVELCAGIGGFGLAGEMAGDIVTTAQVEIDAYCRAVLAKNFPDACRFKDLRTFTYAAYKSALRKKGIRSRAIDIVSGGIPCQPFSHAGKRGGESDDRHLWPAMFGFVRESRPRWVIIENVTGILSMDGGRVFERIVTDLESASYTAEAYSLPAVAVGAPHERMRIWIIAHRNEQQRHGGGRARGWRSESSDRHSNPADTDGQWQQQPGGLVGEVGRRPANGCQECASPHAIGSIGDGWPGAERNIANGEIAKWQEGAGGHQRPAKYATAHAGGGRRRKAHQQNHLLIGQPDADKGYWGASPHTNLQRRAKCVPAPLRGGQGQPIRNLHPGWDEEWLSVASALCRVDDGVSAGVDGIGNVPADAPPKKTKKASGRGHRLKALGNAIVPQVAAQIFAAILQYESEL